MTTQPPEAERLHHLLDRLLRGVLLPEEREQLAVLVRELEADLHRYEEVVVGDLNEANIGLQREVARLTAGQCTHALAVCEQHHAVPVAGCPYPRCRAARGDQPTATPRAPGVVDLPDISNA
ncbi:integral membrane sensor signal transduction histidine kinase [Streptomyces sp. CBMAI 2042]|uniref:hypothetical protein n=1 Tax=Streptomyces sp. CBMAI 2042 TaxID=2305222 RepID=UPI000F28973D|nr:hypothetical protein [Streptomyces sp. CBMAI 2042]RLV66323.1 integral membrane sensor signal transduction histidine kinase [Streptomyces sp. CBMAI 2042]